jgi:TetR/AcrR family transcriptional repressor of mexCD-oprJ operon
MPDAVTRGGGQPVRSPRGDRRSDARRNVAAILDAAVICLARDPDASLADIAKTAGLGRVTLYGHFKTRADLVGAVLTHLDDQAGAVLRATDTSGNPREALARLVASSWETVDRYECALRAARGELPAEHINACHDRTLRRLEALLARGQRAGLFRTDLSRQWLVSLSRSVMQAAAQDRTAGRLDDPAPVVTATLLAAFTPPGEAVPAPPPG